MPLRSKWLMFGGILIAIVVPGWVLAQTGPIIVVDPGDGQNGMTMALQCDGEPDEEFTDHGTNSSAPYISSRWFKPEGASEMVLHRAGQDPERIWKVEITAWDLADTKQEFVLVIQHDLPDFVPVWNVADHWVSSHGDDETWYRGTLFGYCVKKFRINDTEDLDLEKDEPKIEIHYNPRPADTCQ